MKDYRCDCEQLACEKRKMHVAGNCLKRASLFVICYGEKEKLCIDCVEALRWSNVPFEVIDEY